MPHCKYRHICILIHTSGHIHTHTQISRCGTLITLTVDVFVREVLEKL